MPESTLDALKSGGWLSRPINGRQAPETSGPLAGLSYVAKDLFDIAGMPTVAGSPSNLGSAPAKTDAEAIAVLEGAGAQLIALSNMDPLAYGFVTDNPIYGPAHNPNDPSRICGGSSGGSAGAVAARLVDFSLGTDTSGSIRVPAAFTGIFGFKPTANMFSAEGVASLSPTLDRVGLFARDAKTLAAVARCLANGKLPEQPESKLPKIACLGGYFNEGLSEDVGKALENAYANLGMSQTVSVPNAARARAAAYIIVAHEAFETHREELKQRRETFDTQTRARLIAAAAVPKNWVDAARKFQREFTEIFEQAFGAFDFLIAPTVPTIAPLLEELRQPSTDLSRNLRASLGVYTQPISLTGYPVLSVPIWSAEAHMPTALQVIARPGCDAALLDFAKSLPPYIAEGPSKALTGKK